MTTPASSTTLRDILLIGFCAIFMLVAKMALRLNLGIPGHAMFFTIFFLILPRAVTGLRFAATATGLAAGLASVLLGMGKGGPLLLLKFLFPSLFVDAAFLLFPGYGGSLIFCGLVGLVAAASRIAGVMATDYLVGMDTAIIMAHATLKTIGGALFGAAGGLAVAPIIRKLKARGMISVAPHHRG
ncbi:hypothetical protein [Pseudodesulfovibrio sediminis]|uniref:Energy-coupling factor transport system substrate-specific component n=1 Tax=Pseudodesulfovibrio sediminis TaxID=2810563 RepID=A0ABN6ES65_9BACT|nr:hypothetical protein [Pseudodesulfovibrio sediminis]BCS88075.1 hypothetical protein PSDVSF_13170 [Pseudodesulfovibrio sediminis]